MLRRWTLNVSAQTQGFRPTRTINLVPELFELRPRLRGNPKPTAFGREGAKADRVILSHRRTRDRAKTSEPRRIVRRAHQPLDAHSH
jgi:hypothetical protein